MITPATARQIYTDAFNRDPEWHVVDRPQVCEAVQLRAWQAVIDAIRREIELACKLAVKIAEDAERCS